MVRVRLRFDSTPVHYARQCWFLFDPDSCRLVGDVAYLIAKRFNLQDAHGIQLYMDDCLIPSNESAHILKDNDMVRVRTIEEAGIVCTDASSSPERLNSAVPLKKPKLGHKKRKKEKKKAAAGKRTSPSPGTSKTIESIGTGTASVGPSSSQRLREVTTQSAAGATHTKFCSSSDSEPDELPLSSVAAPAAHTPTTTTPAATPASQQQQPPSKNRKNRKTFPSVVGGPSDVHTTKNVMYRRVEETPPAQEQRLEHTINGTGSKEERTGREEFRRPPAVALPVLKSTKDYTALPDLHGAPRNGDHIAFKTLELSLPDYTPEVSEYKEAAVLDYDASAKIVKLKLSEATLRKEMLKASEVVKGRFTLEEDAQEPLTECQDVVELSLEQLLNLKLVPA